MLPQTSGNSILDHLLLESHLASEAKDSGVLASHVARVTGSQCGLTLMREGGPAPVRSASARRPSGRHAAPAAGLRDQGG